MLSKRGTRLVCLLLLGSCAVQLRDTSGSLPVLLAAVLPAKVCCSGAGSPSSACSNWYDPSCEHAQDIFLKTRCCVSCSLRGMYIEALQNSPSSEGSSWYDPSCNHALHCRSEQMSPYTVMLACHLPMQGPESYTVKPLGDSWH